MAFQLSLRIVDQGMYANQQITTTVTEPGISWFTDSYIPVPELRFPADSARYCPPITPKKSQNSGVVLKWDSVVGATFYILQISLDSQQFSGPGLKSFRLTPTEYNLKYIDDIRLGQTLYWRVYAHNSVGGQSLSSEIRSVTLECSGFDGLGLNPEDPASSIPQFSCDAIGADIKIVGAATLRKGDTDRLYVVDISYDCKSFDGQEVEVTDVEWTVDVPDPDVGSDPVAEIVSQTNQYVELRTSSSLVKPHTFDLQVEVTFTQTNPISLAETTIVCTKKRRILVEGTGSGVANIRHAVVRRMCSQVCNTYEVEFVTRRFDESCGGTGTGTNTSTGTGTS